MAMVGRSIIRVPEFSLSRAKRIQFGTLDSLSILYVIGEPKLGIKYIHLFSNRKNLYPRR